MWTIGMLCRWHTERQTVEEVDEDFSMAVRLCGMAVRFDFDLSWRQTWQALKQ